MEGFFFGGGARIMAVLQNARSAFQCPQRADVSSGTDGNDSRSGFGGPTATDDAAAHIQSSVGQRQHEQSPPTFEESTTAPHSCQPKSSSRNGKSPTAKLVITVCLVFLFVSGATGYPFFFSHPFPSNSNPCACIDNEDTSCIAYGWIQTAEAEKATQPNRFNDETNCFCWDAALTANRTFDVLAHCSGEPNTVVQLRIDAHSALEGCVGRSALAVASCTSLVTKMISPHQMWVTRPDGTYLAVGRDVLFEDTVAVPQPLPEQRNATWAFYPMDAKCAPFSLVVQTPESCIYNAREYEIRFTEMDIKLNTMIWSASLFSYTEFINYGGFKRLPHTAMVLTACIWVIYIPCAKNLTFSQFLVSVSIAWALWSIARLIGMCLTFQKYGLKRIKIPTPFEFAGSSMVLGFYCLQMMVLLWMANLKT
jgi:hypothetical protein